MLLGTMSSRRLFAFLLALISTAHAAPVLDNVPVLFEHRVKEHRAGANGDLVVGEEGFLKVMFKWDQVEAALQYEVKHIDPTGHETTSTVETDHQCGGYMCFIKKNCPRGINAFAARTLSSDNQWTRWSTQLKFDVEEPGSPPLIGELYPMSTSPLSMEDSSADPLVPALGAQSRTRVRWAGENISAEFLKVIFEWDIIESAILYEVCHECDIDEATGIRQSGTISGGAAGTTSSVHTDSTTGGRMRYVVPSCPKGINSFAVRALSRTEAGEQWTRWSNQIVFDVQKPGYPDLLERVIADAPTKLDFVQANREEETRAAADDGEMHTEAQFIEHYGGTEEWDAAGSLTKLDFLHGSFTKDVPATAFTETESAVVPVLFEHRVKEHRAGANGDLVVGEEGFLKVMFKWNLDESAIEFEVKHIDPTGHETTSTVETDQQCGGYMCFIKKNCPRGINAFTVRALSLSDNQWTRWSKELRFDVEEPGWPLLIAASSSTGDKPIKKKDAMKDYERAMNEADDIILKADTLINELMSTATLPTQWAKLRRRVLTVSTDSNRLNDILNDIDEAHKLLHHLEAKDSYASRDYQLGGPLGFDPCAAARSELPMFPTSGSLSRASCKLASTHVNENYQRGVKVPCVTPDDHVKQYIENCVEDECPRFTRGIQPPHNSQERVPLAFTIVAHHDALSVLRLINAIWEPHHTICLAMDSKSSDMFKDALRALTGTNIFIASTLQDIQYRSWSRVAADHDCFADLIARRDASSSYGPWRYVINLTGQMMPMQPIRAIEQSIAALNDVALVEIVKFNALPSFEEITKKKKRLGNTRRKYLVKGSGLVALPFRYVDALMKEESAPVLEWIKTASEHIDADPFERIYSTIALLPGWPGGFVSATGVKDHALSHFRAGWHATFVEWRSGSKACSGKPVDDTHPCVFGAGDLKHLLYSRSGKKCGDDADAYRPVCESDALFVNKFDSRVDSVVRDCFALELQPGERE